MRNWKYEALLASVIAARSTSFIFSKMALTDMGVFNLLAVRFLLAFLLLLALFFKRLAGMGRYELFSGIAVGSLYFLVMVCELNALKLAPTSTVSLLENCSIIFVPLFEAVLVRRFPDKTTVICTLAAMLGVLCITLHQGGLSGGMTLGLLAAVVYAAVIIVTGRLSARAKDPLCIGVVEIGTMGMLALASSFVFETPRLPANGSQWLMILALAVVCTGFGFTLQPVAQSRVSVERAGLFCAIEPAIATILGVAVLSERFGVLSAAGLLLILLSIILPYMMSSADSNRNDS